jgi:hypothetical protein
MLIKLLRIVGNGAIAALLLSELRPTDLSASWSLRLLIGSPNWTRSLWRSMDRLSTYPFYDTVRWSIKCLRLVFRCDPTSNGTLTTRSTFVMFCPLFTMARKQRCTNCVGWCDSQVSPKASTALMSRSFIGMVEFAKLLTIAKAMSSTLIAYGSDTSYSKESWSIHGM